MSSAHHENQPANPGENSDMSALLDHHCRSGVAAMRQCLVNESIKHFLRCLEIAPLHKESLFALGVLRHKAGNLEPAATAFRRVCVSYPSEPQALYNLAAISLQISQVPTAIAALRQALALSPAENLYISLLAQTFSNNYNYLEAAKLYGWSYYLQPEETGRVLLFAHTLRLLGLPVEGTQLLVSLLEKGRSGKEILNHLSLCLLSINDWNVMVDLFNRSQHATPAFLAYEGIGLLVAIYQSDRDRTSTLLSTWLQSNYYTVPYVQSFYMKLTLSRAEMPAVRRLPSGDRRAIHISSIGHFGRLAHSLGNYIVASLFCQKHGYELHTPHWQGHYIFDIDDPIIDKRPDHFLPEVMETSALMLADNPVLPGRSDEGVDLFSPYLENFFHADREPMRRLTRFRKHWEERFGRILANIKQDSRHLVCCHIRLGDMEWKMNEHYGRISYKIYTDWLDAYLREFPDAKVFVSTDEPNKARTHFAPYGAVFCDDVLPDHYMIGHVLDFYMLCHADVVTISRGGFGKLGCALNSTAYLFLKPDDLMNPTRLVAFDLWK